MAGQQTDQGRVDDDGGLSDGTVLDDKFRVERLLGMGGMGAVYEITHMLTKHRRAMKLLHPQYAQHKMVVERFFREASAAGHIGNDHIIETFDAGWLASGEPYLVMELLDGMPLADRIEEQPQGMDLGEVVEIFDQLCDGVQAAHDAGIVHRDLKPDNVFLGRSSGAWLVKVLDFGVSKFDEKLATKLTSGDSMVGTPAYMSPEQFDRGADVDPPSDVYALGIILYEMLTGLHPYPAETLAQLVKMILASSPVPASELRPDLPRAAQDLLDRMIAIAPEDRVGSPREAAARLAAIVRDAGADLALHSTALPDPGDPALEATVPHELAFDRTVVADAPPSSGAVPSGRGAARFAETEVMVEDEPGPSADGEEVDEPPKSETSEPAPHSGEEIRHRPDDKRPALYAVAALVTAGALMAATQLGDRDPGDDAAASSSASADGGDTDPSERDVTPAATATAAASPLGRPTPPSSAAQPRPDPTASVSAEASAAAPPIPQPPRPTPAGPAPKPTAAPIATGAAQIDEFGE